MAARYLDFELEEVDSDTMILILASVVAFIYEWIASSNMGQGVPRHLRDMERGLYLRRILEERDVNCVNMIRMRRGPFFNLCAILRGRNLLQDTRNTSIEEQVAMFLHTLGHDQRNRVIGNSFIRSGETISRHFHNVLHAIGTLRNEYIVGPNSSVHPYVRESDRFYPYFKDCVGALDGTHIDAKVPSREQGPFRGRKNNPTQNVLAVVDFDTRFTYVLAGWEGSAHDAMVLRDAVERPSGLKVPEGKYYLCDAGYSTKAGFISPYRGVRYHLSDYRNGREPQNHVELFNYRHSSLRMVVERSFGLLKGRFKILNNKPFFPFRTQVDLVIVCCLLHNFILQHGNDELHMDEGEWVAQNLSQVGRTEGSIREEMNLWVQKREDIALAMWHDYHAT